ncbi:nuclear transport factor 2 family protein [Caulobacter sp. RHG1]|uniref:nuclear transport factor 2 family protein n=1 Tax=Caulobacter sp. (strain RHG1) TaxID=2545762 RepID=UPI0015522B14|nr:nuclear transport factor 2 family protein [Caulobacter sp. RHG1]NQE64947.1 hypothetical protein [Caulobacter sp. RHG1]
MTAEAERSAQQTVLARSYEAVNAQDLAATRAVLHPDVSWPDTLEGGRLHGRNAVVAHLAQLFALTRPNVQLIRVVAETEGELDVEVQLLVEDHKGHIWSDTRARLTYRFRDGLLSDVIILSGV